MFTFQSKYRGLTFEGLPGVEFKNGFYHTEDKKIADKLRKKADVFETTGLVEPPQNPNVVRGPRPSTVQEGESA